jgi:signal transduction histidine kinase
MTRTFNHLLIAGAILVLVGGFALTIWMAQHEEIRLQEDLLTKCRLVKEGFSADEIGQLTVMEADLTSPVYLSIKKEIRRIRFADPPIRFLYFMGQRPDGTIVFLVDSEPPESEDYSPPGQEYPEATNALRTVFVTNAEMTEGPVADRWGSWISGIIPVSDPGTGRVIAVFGMDVDARDWNLKILMACLPAIIATLILLLLISVFTYIHQRGEREKQLLEESHRVLSESENSLKQVNDKLNLMNRITRHDILNQLTGIVGYLDMMKQTSPDPRMQKYAEIVLRSATNIQDQILFTKEYQDIGSQAPRWFDLERVIMSAAEKLTLAPITLAVAMEPVEIYADPLLEKVFYTLLENGIRHGEKLTAMRFSCREAGTALVISYEDNGAGVPAAYKEDIFDQKYFRHTGYGLYLSRTILGITGITIIENGEPGTGARFEITVPAGAWRYTGKK